MNEHYLIGLCYILITLLLLICLKTSSIPMRLKIGLVVLMSGFLYRDLGASQRDKRMVDLLATARVFSRHLDSYSGRQ